MSDNLSPVEQGGSDVGGPKGRQLSLGQKLGIAALIGLTALGFVWFNAVLKNHAPPPDKLTPTAQIAGQAYTPPPPLAAKAEQSDLPLPAAAPNPAVAPQETAPPPILAYSGGGPSNIGARSEPVMLAEPGNLDTSSAATSTSAVADAPESDMARKLKPTALNGSTASVVKNPDTMITEGTEMPCILQTAIDTQLAGFVTCVIPIDVRGTTGNVVLLDRGTRIVGQIESGLMQGQDRVFVLWTRAETPHHVIISLNAPGADELGRAGLAGAVNNHWWDRFGGALMLTLVQGSLNAGTALAANSGNGPNGAALGYVYSAQSTGNQVANTALENSINIPPTLNKNQGDTVSVFVVQDLDFSSVYGLKLSDSSHAQ